MNFGNDYFKIAVYFLFLGGNEALLVQSWDGGYQCAGKSI